MPTAKLPYVDPVVTPTVLSGAWVGGAEAGVRQTANRVAMAKAVLEAQTRAGIAALEASSRNRALAAQERLESKKQAADMQMFLKELEADTKARATEFDNKKTLARMQIEAEKSLRAADPDKQFVKMQMDALDSYMRTPADKRTPEMERNLALRLTAGTAAFGNQLGLSRMMSGATGELDMHDPMKKVYWQNKFGGDPLKAEAAQQSFRTGVLGAYEAAVQKAKYWSEQPMSTEALTSHARAVNDVMEAEAKLRSFYGHPEVKFPFSYDEKILTHVTRRKEVVEEEEERKEGESNFDLLDTALTPARSFYGGLVRHGTPIAKFGLKAGLKSLATAQEEGLAGGVRTLAGEATEEAEERAARATHGIARYGTKLLKRGLRSISLLGEDESPRPGESIATNVTARLPQPTGARTNAPREVVVEENGKRVIRTQ